MGAGRRPTLTLTRMGRWLLVVLVLLSLAGLGPARAEILWRVQGADADDSYLLGTIHSDDERVLARMRDLAPYLAATATLVIEVQPDALNDVNRMQMMFFADGTRLSGLLRESDYDAVVAALTRRGFPAETVDLLKPWAAGMVLSLPADLSAAVLDLRLAETARQQGMHVTGLENLHEQLLAFDGLSLRHQIEMLTVALASLDAVDATYEQLIDQWLDGNLEDLARTAEASLSTHSTELRTQLIERLVTTRNRRMAERMRGHLDAGGAFIAIGAMHLPGDAGVLELLRRGGYSVQPVHAEFRGQRSP